MKRQEREKVMTNGYYQLKAYGETYNVRPVRTHYCNNNALAILLVEDTGEQFAVITVNLEETNMFTNPALAFIDTNNCDWAENFLKENNLAKPAGYYGHSGWCTYPLYMFDMEKIPAEE